MTTEQEALNLAEQLDEDSGFYDEKGYFHNVLRDSAAMLRKLVAEREADRAAMREALEAMEPVSAYGRVGSRDVEQAALQSAITHLRQRLEGTT